MWLRWQVVTWVIVPPPHCHPAFRILEGIAAGWFLLGGGGEGEGGWSVGSPGTPRPPPWRHGPLGTCPGGPCPIPAGHGGETESRRETCCPPTSILGAALTPHPTHLCSGHIWGCPGTSGGVLVPLRQGPQAQLRVLWQVWRDPGHIWNNLWHIWGLPGTPGSILAHLGGDLQHIWRGLLCIWGLHKHLEAPRGIWRGSPAHAEVLRHIWMASRHSWLVPQHIWRSSCHTGVEGCLPHLGGSFEQLRGFSCTPGTP